MEADGAKPDAPSTAPPSTWRRVLEGLGFCLPPLLFSSLYLPCLTYSEWYVDELFAVLRNPDARGETPLGGLLVNDFWGNPLYGGAGVWTHKSYRPLTVLSFAWQFRLLGGELFRPQPLRAFNVALHAANSLLLLVVLQRCLRLPRRWSCLAACLFAAHPVHVENIVYLVGRADMLATTGWLLAACVQLRQRAAPRVVGTCLRLGLCTLFAVLAGLCKESGFTLLVFVAGAELCSEQAQRRRACVAVLALSLFMLVAIARFRVTQGTAAAFGFVDTPIQYQREVDVRAWSYLFQHAFYAKLLVLPGSLSWDYSYDALPLLRAAWRDVRALAVATAYLALAALASWSLRKGGCRRLLLGLQHMLVPFVPAANLFFVVGVTVGERLLYPSTAGAAIAAAALGARLERSPRGLRRRWPTMAARLLLALYAWRCGVRIWQWRSSEALYAADAAAWPRSVKTRHQLGTVYHAQGRYDEALDHYNASLNVLDDNALTDHCIAQIYIETGRYNQALARFEKILGGHGVGFSAFNLWMLYVDYGFVLVALSRFQEALQPLQYGLQRNTAVPHGLNALGYAHASLQQLQEAQDAFAKGLEYDTDNALLWSNLAVVWMVAGELQQAAQGLEKALLLEPENPIIVHNAMLLKAAAEQGGVLNGRPRLELFFSRLT